MSPQTLIILGVCGAALLYFAIRGDGEVKPNSTDKNAKAKSRWAGKKAIRKARDLAVSQLHGRRRKAAALYLIRPKMLEYHPDTVNSQRKKKPNGEYVKTTFPPAPGIGKIDKKTHPIIIKKEKFGFYSNYKKKRCTGETIWIPDTERSVAVIGAPGSGKTFSAIDPMLRSIVEQGFPIILYDFKFSTQSRTIAWYAKKLGYDITVFSPGYEYTSRINILDFLTGDPEIDGAYARQLANTLNKNFRLGSSGGADPFFDNAGDQLVQAVLMLAKQTAFPDLMMAQVILSAPQLIDRLFPQSSGIHPWIRKAFDQIFSVKDSEKTVSSIVGTATLNFTRLMMPKILSSIVGTSNMPIKVEGKQMVIFGMDREIRDVVGPIIATVIHMMVNENLFIKPNGRKDPLYCVLDELPTIFLPQLKNWINESRSDGFNGIIGFQNTAQLDQAYGKDNATPIIGGCATKFIFNPGEIGSAEQFSKFFGTEEVARSNTSKTLGSGRPSRNKSIETYTRPLIAPEEFLQLPPGTCIFTNPAYEDDRSSYLARRIEVNLPPDELELAEMIENGWPEVEADLKAKSEANHEPIDKDAVQMRIDWFNQHFPIPDDDAESANPQDLLAGLV
ncbi:MAG: type IV secretion system DNA-binding domain-containing protein [Cyanobacteria bacterium P01_A01_bin.37]